MTVGMVACQKKDGYRFENKVDSFYYSLKQMGKVDSYSTKFKGRLD